MKRIYLRALELDDYKVTYLWRNDEEITKMVGGPKYFVSIEKEKEWIRNSIFDTSRIVLGICLTINNKLIGTVNIQDMDMINRKCRVPILIGDKQEWNKGYATEARMQALDFVFNERGLERVGALILESNIQSIKMHEKCGFIKEGFLRKSIFKNGEYHNQVLMGLLKEDFIPLYKEYQKKYLNE